MKKIAIITTHPIQYQIPLFKQFRKNIEAHVFFASSHGYKSKKKDKEFRVRLNWDQYKNPLQGFKSYFSKSQKYSIFEFKLSFSNLEYFFKKNRFDAVLIFGWNNLFYLKSLFLAKKYKIKTILRVETNLKLKISLFKKTFKFFVLKFFFRFIDAFLYIGNLNKIFLIYHGVPKKKLFYAPYFVDNNFFKKKKFKNFKKKINLNDKKIILFVGKLIDRKNPEDFLKLATNFKKYKKLHFMIIGDGYLKSYCKNFIKENRLNNVTIMGFQNQKMLREIYNISDLLILTSKYETWGLVVNEAMACGLPVISTEQCGSSRDLISNGITGYTYSFGDMKRLNNIFKKIIFNPKRHKKMKKNVLLKISKFSPQNTMKSIERILYD